VSVPVLNARAATALWAGLTDAGVQHAVVSPGSRNTPVLLAAAARRSLRCHVVHDERAAGFLALGLARASGTPVALSCTSGSAGAHYLPAFMEATAEGVPLVALTADRPPELHRCGANQTVEQGRLLGDFARPFSLGAPFERCEAAWRQAGRRAGREAWDAPIHLTLAFREPLWTPEAEAEYAPPVSQPGLWSPGPGALPAEASAALLDRLVGAARGAIHCGAGAAEDPAQALAIRALGRALGWPVLAEAASGVRFVEGEPGAVVSHGDAILRGCAGSVEAPDRVLRFGRPPLTRAVAAWLARAERTLLVDPRGRRMDPSHRADGLVQASPAQLAEALLPELPDDGRGAWAARWRQAEATAAAVLEGECAEGWWEAPIARAVLASSPVIHLGSSMPVRDVDAFAAADGRARRVFANRGLSGIDGTLATAAGEALAEGAVTVLLGDVSFLHDLTGLLAAATLGAPLTVVVVNNGGGGIFGFLPVAEHPSHFERCFVTPHQARVGPLCAGVGVVHERVNDRHALARALSSPTTGPRVIEAVVDRDENVARHRAAWTAVARALHPTHPKEARI
jgi:2-succinyl-5-enolpyruvyl-6-hydroxy-3-cyclohexene-1-carboxylate synthase